MQLLHEDGSGDSPAPDGPPPSGSLTNYAYGDDLISQDRAGVVSYYHYDGNLSTRQLSDISGTIADTYTYDAFGNLLASTGSTSNNYLYTGEQYDPNAGFYYLRARYYNPEIGRFATRDSFSGCSDEIQSLNRYVYARNNPIRRVDPSGNFSNVTEVLTLNSLFRTLAALPSLSVPLITRGEAYRLYRGNCNPGPIVLYDPNNLNNPNPPAQTITRKGGGYLTEVGWKATNARGCGWIQLMTGHEKNLQAKHPDGSDVYCGLPLIKDPTLAPSPEEYVQLGFWGTAQKEVNFDGRWVVDSYTDNPYYGRPGKAAYVAAGSYNPEGEQYLDASGDIRMDDHPSIASEACNIVPTSHPAHSLEIESTLGFLSGLYQDSPGIYKIDPLGQLHGPPPVRYKQWYFQLRTDSAGELIWHNP